MWDRIRHWLRGRSLEDRDLAQRNEKLVAELERQGAELRDSRRREAELQSRLDDPLARRLEAMRRESGDALVKAYMERSGEMLGTLNRALEDDREDRMDFLNLERTLVGDMNRLTGDMLETLVEQAEEQKKTKVEAVCAECGGALRPERRRDRRLLCLFGDLNVRLRVWRCPDCDFRCVPRERILGVRPGGKMTSGLREAVGLLASRESFVGSEELMFRIGGVVVGAKLIEREAELLGEDLARDEIEHVETGKAEAGSVACLAIDGTGVPMRPAETEGRSGKGEDGIARTREAKVVTAWTQCGRDAPSEMFHSAAIESAARENEDTPFLHRLHRQARRVGFHDAERRVILGDGAPWIWNQAELLDPEAEQIVDLFHLLQRLREDCREACIHERAAQREFRRLRAWVKRGHMDRALERLHVLGAASTVNYITRHKERMDYKRYRREGLPHSTAPVESACKNVVGSRMKKGGARWSERGAQAILALRCSVTSGQFDEAVRRVADNFAAGVPAPFANDALVPI